MRSLGVLKTVDLTGGESVFCVNAAQLAGAKRLVEAGGEAALRITQAIETLERDLSRNERAAIAFLLIERLRTSEQ